MCLKMQWDAAGVERQQEVIEHKQFVAGFLEEARSHRHQVSHESAQDRAAYVTAIEDYVWGTTSTSDSFSASSQPTSLTRSTPQSKQKQAVSVRSE